MDRKFEINQLYMGIGILLFFLLLTVFSYRQVTKALANFKSDEYIIASSYNNSSLSNIVNVPLNYYLALEMNLKASGEGYLARFDYNGNIIKYSMLNIKLLDGIDNSECDGYIRIINGFLKPYINCSNYQTEGY